MAYASKYYDPQKAHEYYEKHKQLKGRSERTSTKGLNEEGKLVAKQVKEAINAEKKEFMKALNEKMKERIAQLREELKGSDKETIKLAVAQLRESYKAMKEQAKEAFTEKYAQEMDKIKAEKGYKQAKKSSKKKKKGKK